MSALLSISFSELGERSFDCDTGVKDLLDERVADNMPVIERVLGDGRILDSKVSIESCLALSSISPT